MLIISLSLSSAADRKHSFQITYRVSQFSHKYSAPVRRGATSHLEANLTLLYEFYPTHHNHKISALCCGVLKRAPKRCPNKQNTPLCKKSNEVKLPFTFTASVRFTKRSEAATSVVKQKYLSHQV